MNKFGNKLLYVSEPFSFKLNKMQHFHVLHSCVGNLRSHFKSYVKINMLTLNCFIFCLGHILYLLNDCSLLCIGLFCEVQAYKD